MVDTVSLVLVILSSILFAVAVYYTYRLSEETNRGKYWVFFLLAAIGLGMHEWLKVLQIFLRIPEPMYNLLLELGVVAGAASLSYASYGLYTSMKEIREKVE
jgi:NADH:ubiquinone oxidoreductase subunit 4 (subunit M)